MTILKGYFYTNLVGTLWSKISCSGMPNRLLEDVVQALSMRPVATVVATTAAKNALTKRKGTVVTEGSPAAIRLD